MKKQYLLIAASLFLTIGLIVVVIAFSPNRGLQKNTIDEKEQAQTPIRDTFKPIETRIRKAAVAGDFYPKEPALLNKQLEEYFDSAVKLEEEGKLRILIVPHAGITYSGQTAAKGFAQLKGYDYSKIIIMGVSHRSPIPHAAVYSKGWWETPFGKIEIDEALAQRIISEKNSILADETPHLEEHSLEVPILFLNKVAKDYKIVPILLGRPQDELIDYLAYRLAGIMDDQTLLIISTDLSHYPNWEDANYADRNTIKAILTGEKKALQNIVAYNTPQRYPELSTSACGYHALRVALEMSKILNIDNIQEIDYTNSGDITGEKGRVVGYASIGMWSEKLPPITLSPEAKEEALQLARQSLESYFKQEQLNYTPAHPDLQFPIGAFVTLTKNDELRGCIGHFEPEDPIYKVIQSVAVSSAVYDSRFTPVTKDELADIDIEISTMSPQKLIKHWQDIELGKHGVRIQYQGKAGTLLPQVATDNNMDLITFLETICWQKIGVDKDCYKEPAAQLYVYETDIFAEENED